MFVENLCPPAILYLGFSLTQIIIDLFRKMYNTAMIKIAVTVVFTTVLNMLCKSGLTVISWFIVFIPFVTMTLVTGILLYMFGLGPFTGKMDYSKLKPEEENPAVDRGLGPKEPEEVKPLPGPLPETNPDTKPLPKPEPEPTCSNPLLEEQKLPSLASTFMIDGNLEGVQKPSSFSVSTKKPSFESSLSDTAAPVRKILKTIETTTVNYKEIDDEDNMERGSKSIDKTTTTATF